MTATTSLQLSLDDLLAELRHARRQGDVSRLALLAYCEVRRWARQAGEVDIAEQAAAMITETPYASRQSFLERIDGLIADLDRVRSGFDKADTAASGSPAASPPAAGVGCR